MADTVELSTVDVDAIPAAADASLARSLSSDEQARAAAFVKERDRRRFRRRRASVRRVLSGYLGADPGAIRFEHEERGRPEIAGHPISFSVAHSDGVSLIAVSRRRVGVDVELVRSLDALDELMSVACTDHEIAGIRLSRAMTPSQRFLSIWVVKEAVLKGLGLGLSVDPLDVEVELAPEGTLVRYRGSVLADWTVRSLSHPSRRDLVTAVAVQGAEPVHLKWIQPLSFA